MAIDLRHFRCFVAVAEDLHFHKAAKRLGVAQPALTRTIQNLEGELGVMLLERSNRNVSITKAGATFLKGCREVLAKTDRILVDVQRVHQGKIGTLRVGYTDNAINRRTTTLLKAFQGNQPDIELLLTHAVTSKQLVDLAEGAIDFGFVTGSVPPPGFQHMSIQRESFVCIVYEGHRLFRRKSIRLRDLANEPFVSGKQSEWEHFQSYLRPHFRDAGYEPNVAQEGMTTSEIQRLVACGIGVAVLTESVADTLLPGLSVVPLSDIPDQLETMILWKPEQSNVAKQHFVAFLKDAVPGFCAD